ncbi:diphosphomevalonate decarboxylase [Croceiramulus getboli]|nr:diphosphomevalonate decarboxylase [Flavobacteriaceae bacterium YJPT1-3]
MIDESFIIGKPQALPEVYHTRFTAPSNIALVKYWGKHGTQLPQNANISFTLDHCQTQTSVAFEKKKSPDEHISFEIFLDGQPAPDFKPKIEQFIKRIVPYQPFLNNYTLEIQTRNTFPHSSGIASSASGMAALACCFMDFERSLNSDITDIQFRQKASFLARLGSGSAARSIEGGLMTWGVHPDLPGSSDRYAIAYPHQVHELFTTYQDTILLVDKGEKQVSSTVGHRLMHGHAFAKARFEQANEQMSKLIPVLKAGDLDTFMKIVEMEALSLHAMMMTADPYFMLMKPNTLEIIQKVWDYRKSEGVPLCFTLDAGANVHLLYPETAKEQALQFIEDELVVHCQNGQYICDRVGKGAKNTYL